MINFSFFQENADPALQTPGEGESQCGEEQMQRRDLTVEDEHDIWRDITLTQYKHTLQFSVCFREKDKQRTNLMYRA